jgi:hypothetical protein
MNPPRIADAIETQSPNWKASGEVQYEPLRIADTIETSVRRQFWDSSISAVDTVPTVCYTVGTVKEMK